MRPTYATAVMVLLAGVLGCSLTSAQPSRAANRHFAGGDGIVDVTQTPWGSPEPYGCLTSYYDAASPPQWRCNLDSSGLPATDAAVTSPNVGAVEVNVDWKDVEPCRNVQVWGPLDAEVAAIVKAGKHVVLALRFQSGGGIGPDVGDAWRITSNVGSGRSSTLKISGSPPHQPAAQPYPNGSCPVDLPWPFLVGTTVTATGAGASQDSLITRVVRARPGSATIVVSPRVTVHPPEQLSVPTCRGYSVVGNAATGGFNGLSTDHLPFWEIEAADGDVNHPGALCDASTGVYMPNYWSRTFQRDWLAFVKTVARHFGKPGSAFSEDDPLHDTDYSPSSIDYVRTGAGLSDEGLAYVTHSSLGVQYQSWASRPGVSGEACRSRGSANWSTNWQSWQECMLNQYQAAFTYPEYTSPVVLFPVNVGSKSAAVSHVANSESCDLNGSIRSCSQITLRTPKPYPTARPPILSVRAGSGAFAPIPISAIGSASVTVANPNDHGGYTTGRMVQAVKTTDGVTILTVTPSLPYTDYLAVSWPNVAVARDPTTEQQYWTSVALQVGEWAIVHHMGVGQNGLSSGWALNWHTYSYLQGSRTGVKTTNYYPETPASLDAQTMLQLSMWSGQSGKVAPVSELQTVNSTTDRCTSDGAGPGEVNVCTPYATMSPTPYPYCARWNAQWTAWLGQSSWRYNQQDSGLPGYYPTTLEIYSNDLDDEIGVDNTTNSSVGIQGVQTTYRDWSSRSEPPQPPTESKWNLVCP